jgi:hypothetical protein
MDQPDGIIKYFFANDAYPNTELTFNVNYLIKDLDQPGLEDRAYAMLQMVHPNSWHNWRLEDSMEI